jgi:DNA-binding transcriptional ArsR family regulator
MLLQANPRAISLKAKLFRGFADASRLAIVEALRRGPMTVTEIADAAGLSPSNASNHLRCLWDCGLVERQQDGRFVRYHLSDPRIDRLLDLADQLLADVASGVYACTRYEPPATPVAGDDPEGSAASS